MGNRGGGGVGLMGKSQKTFPQEIINKKYIYSYAFWPKKHMPKEEKKKVFTSHVQKEIFHLLKLESLKSRISRGMFTSTFPAHTLDTPHVHPLLCELEWTNQIRFIVFV